MFPRTTVGGVSMPRMLIGSNWILGYSHRTSSHDEMIKARNHNPEAVSEILQVFLNAGIDAFMGLFKDAFLQEAIADAEAKTGKKIIIIDTPIINVDDTPEARKEAEATIKASKAYGATFCLPHHSSVEQLVNKNKQVIDRLPDYLSMIREQGMIPGLSAHMPECIIYSDQNEYDVETYIQIYNCMGFLMQVEIEYIHKIIHAAKKPVMTIKPFAAGRCTPFVGLNFNYNTLREQDMVTVGCYTPAEAAEDIEIGLAAIERRMPGTKGRGSMHKTEIMKD